MTVLVALFGYLLGVLSCVAAAHLIYCWKSGRHLTGWRHARIH